MIGRLVLSNRTIYQLKLNKKNTNAKKCIVLSESNPDTLVKTSKEFNPRDEYIKFNPQTNSIIEGLGSVGLDSADLDIYYHLFTNGWETKSKYSKLWDEYLSTNPSDLAISTNISRLDYNEQVNTIDPIGSIDLDDGFSFNYNDEYWNLTIHIADPVSWFDLTNPLFVKIFQELQKRLQSCYISSYEKTDPTHLLPLNIVKLVSLLEIIPESNIKTRRAISFCFKISKQTNTIEKFNITHTNLSNIKNYSYSQYSEFINCISNTELKNELIGLINTLKNIIGLSESVYKDFILQDNITHGMIEIFMILVNWYGGNYLINKLNKSNTIIRVQDKKDINTDNEVNFDIRIVPEYAQPYLSTCANYTKYNDSTNQKHYSLNISNYTHLSSPMRRFIDMLNHFGFYELDWSNISNINYLNNNSLNKINTQIKIQKKIYNGWKLVKFVKTYPETKKFRACLFDWNCDNQHSSSTKINCLVVLFQKEYNFISMVNVELPQIESTQNLKKYIEWDIELYYNSNNFKSIKFPFSIKIL